VRSGDQRSEAENEMPANRKSITAALGLVDRLSLVASDIDQLIAQANTRKTRASLYFAKSVINQGKLRILQSAAGNSRDAAKLLLLKSKNGPDCGTGAGGFKPGNDCAAGKNGSRSSGGSGTAAGSQATARPKRQRKIDPARPKFYEKSDVRWEHGKPNSDQVKKLRQQLGANYEKRLLAVSGVPDGSQVDLAYMGNYVYVTARNSQFGTVQNRYVYFGADGQKPHVYNAYFKVAQEKQGNGAGAEIFFAQVEASARAKFGKIKVTAARSSDMNGYYTWARFGYDADISSLDGSMASRIQSKFPNVNRLSDLMKTSKGREWWKKNGDTWRGTFDLSPNSESRKRLRNYMAARRREYRKTLAASSPNQSSS
jgi:hypothetical protein